MGSTRYQFCNTEVNTNTNIERNNKSPEGESKKLKLLTVAVLWMIRYDCFWRVGPQAKHGMCKCVEGHIHGKVIAMSCCIPKPLPLCCHCHARNIIIIMEGILTPTTVWYSRLSCPVLH